MADLSQRGDGEVIIMWVYPTNVASVHLVMLLTSEQVVK